MKTYYENSQAVIAELCDLLQELSLEEVANYEQALLSAREVFFIGVGRVRLALEAVVKRYTHLGITCHMVGDLNEPPIINKDLLVVGSGSGESIIPLEITKKAQSFQAEIIHLTANPNSSIAKLADHILTFNSPTKESEKVVSIQPMTTVFEQGLLVFHDILALQIMVQKGLTFDALKKRHANLE